MRPDLKVDSRWEMAAIENLVHNRYGPDLKVIGYGFLQQLRLVVGLRVVAIESRRKSWRRLMVMRSGNQRRSRGAVIEGQQCDEPW